MNFLDWNTLPEQLLCSQLIFFACKLPDTFHLLPLLDDIYYHSIKSYLVVLLWKLKTAKSYLII